MTATKPSQKNGYHFPNAFSKKGIRLRKTSRDKDLKLTEKTQKTQFSGFPAEKQIEKRSHKNETLLSLKWDLLTENMQNSVVPDFVRTVCHLIEKKVDGKQPKLMV